MEEMNSILEDINAEEVEASLGQRSLAIILDIILEVSLIVAFYFLAPREKVLQILDIHPYMTYVLAFIIIFSYRVICISIFGRTIGMMICNLKYLNNNLQALSSKQKLIAIIASRTSGIRFYKI
jgi:uncharacterized RDD family membrane protein YckC